MKDPTSQARRRHRGLNSLEFALLLVLLGLIAASIYAAVAPRLDEIKQDTARLDMANIHQALERYQERHGAYPGPAIGLRALVEARLLDKVPRDPWNHVYVYALGADKPLLLSYGADGLPGGENADMDLVSPGK